MERKIINIIKKILPSSVVSRLERVRRSLRMRYYYSFNAGLSFFKEVHSLGSHFYICINPYKNGTVDRVILKRGKWEEGVAAVIKKHLPSEGVFLDIGGNIGYYSLFAKTIQSDEGKVLVFEPMKSLCKQIRQSIIENEFKNVQLFECGLSNVSGQSNLLLIDENIGGSSIKRRPEDPLVSGSEIIVIEKLDSFSDYFDRLDLIKIDVEGNEFESLLGGENVIKKFHPIIIIEFTPDLYEKDYVGKSKSFLAWLENLGYKFYHLDGSVCDLQKRIQGGDLEQIDIYASVNK